MTRSIFAAAVFGVMVMGNNADAAFVYSNFGPGNSFNTSSGTFVNQGTVRGVQFTATGNGTLTQVVLPMSKFFGSGAITVELHADNAGEVGSSLASGALTLTSRAATLYTVAMSSASIVSGDQYWLMLIAASDATRNGWLNTAPAVSGTLASSSDGGSTYSYINTLSLPAFSVEAAPVSAVPEPSSFLMFGLGGLALGVRSLRRVKQAIV